jgi:hypothetical protein
MFFHYKTLESSVNLFKFGCNILGRGTSKGHQVKFACPFIFVSPNLSLNKARKIPKFESRALSELPDSNFGILKPQNIEMKCYYSGQTLKVLFARDDPVKRGVICTLVSEFIEKNL